MLNHIHAIEAQTRKGFHKFESTGTYQDCLVRALHNYIGVMPWASGWRYRFLRFILRQYM
jgi:hypothetical protein